MKPKFKIGDWVSVSSIVSFHYNKENERQMSKEECQPWLGQVVGARHKAIVNTVQNIEKN